MSKKSTLFFLISILFALSANAQQKDTLIYFMKNAGPYGVPTSVKDSADFYRMIFPADSGAELSGYTVKDYYLDKKPKMIGKTTNHHPFLKLQGSNIEFFPNGKKRAIKNFINGIPTGDVTAYYPNGRIYIIGVYGNLNKLYITECRDSAGKALAENGNGYCLKYDDDFKRVVAEGKIINNLEQGEWHGQLNDSMKYVCTYENGVIKKGISYSNNGTAYPFSQMEVEPVFKGGIEAFYQLIRQNVHYPVVAKRNNIQGRVFISFVIEKDGSLTHVRVVRSLGSGCDEEAARAIKLSPPWIPGTQFGIPVRVQYTMPISFTLQGSR